NIRSKVHEYGGKPYAIDSGAIYFINFSDQILYLHKGDKSEPLTDGTIRFVDLITIPGGVIAVGEEHKNGMVSNFIARVDAKTKEIHTLALGQDFYGGLSLSPDKKNLTWLSWNHPNMPWDGTELWIAHFHEGKLANPE